MPEIKITAFVGMQGVNFHCEYCGSRWKESTSPRVRQYSQPCKHRSAFVDVHYPFPLDPHLTACTRHETSPPDGPTSTNERRVTCEPCRLWIGKQRIMQARNFTSEKERKAYVGNFVRDPNAVMVALLQASDVQIPDRLNWTPDMADDPDAALADKVTASKVQPIGHFG